MNNELLHYGKKGMKWGVRKAGRTAKDYVKSSVKSKVREYAWGKKVAKRSKMSMKELKETTTRLQNENRLKALSRGITNVNKKKVYRNRANISNRNLSRIVNRYQLEANLSKSYKQILSNDKKAYDRANKTVQEVAKQIAKQKAKQAATAALLVA